MVVRLATRGVRRWLGALALLVFLPLGGLGCFGRFQLLRNVYHWNQQVSQDKWTQWLAFLVLNVVPVYGIAAWIDALVTNSIEFWTGENPVQPADAGTTRVVERGDGSRAELRLEPDGRIAVTVSEPGRAAQSFWLVREPEAVAAYDARGRLLARVGDVAGEPTLVRGSLAPAAVR